MFGKLLLTVVVIIAAFLVVRERWRSDRAIAGAVAPRSPLIPPVLIRALAYLLLASMVIGSAIYLVLDMGEEPGVVQAQVVNANTGSVTQYLIRRDSLDGRRFVTADGREVRLADVERLIIGAAP
ncbi:MAG: hypothetical protein EOM91_08195 [Sphingobacteriia bacterium]|nr:hypothetical protein [Sphingobacteriia bacterium]NCC40081.1 hypothetical protein [Gammaproteobacteria bacterium]